MTFAPAESVTWREASTHPMMQRIGAFDRFRRAGGVRLTRLRGIAFLPGIHAPLLSAAILRPLSSVCCRSRVASGSGSAIALDSYSAALLSRSATVFSGATIFKAEFMVAACDLNLQGVEALRTSILDRSLAKPGIGKYASHYCGHRRPQHSFAISALRTQHRSEERRIVPRAFRE